MLNGPLTTGALQDHRPALVLAPMEGVTDRVFRRVFTDFGGYDLSVTEFLRITDQSLPAKVFRRHLPEIAHAGQTAAGVSVQLQILGGDAGRMAENAATAIAAGARAIDINFGCPAPTVNRHDGGAAILRYPERIQEIVSRVRAAVPMEFPVSAKLRLGWENMEDIHLNAERAILGGASWITIHARTKMQGYRPPAHWSHIAAVRQRADCPVVANGDLWTLKDFKLCQEITGCRHFMLGRSALANPGLAHLIRDELGITPMTTPKFSWLRDPNTQGTPETWLRCLEHFCEVAHSLGSHDFYVTRKLKQWLRFATLRESLPWFDTVKRLETSSQILDYFRAAAADQNAWPMPQTMSFLSHKNQSLTA